MIPLPSTCAGCPLHFPGRAGWSVVTGSGRTSLIIIGEASGDKEEKEARPFVEYAPAGSLLERALRELGIRRNDLLITNVLRCFSGDTLVQASDIEKAYRRWYEGDLVKVSTNEGILTGTPNHPVLTPQGWIALGSLSQGSYIARGLLTRRMRAGDPYINYQPIRFDQLFDALAQLSIGERVVGRDVDFHGDGFESEVDVVSHDCLLLNRAQSFQSEHNKKVALKGADFAFGFGVGESTCDRSLLHHSRCKGSAFAGAVSGGSQCHTSFWPCTLEPDTHGFRSVTYRNTRDEESIPQARLSDSVFHSQGFQGLSGFVSFSKVFKVEWLSFSGHVYNLQTTSGQYTANGYIVSNCRPPGNKLRGASYETEAIAHCSTYLDEVIARYKPRAILALGVVALRELLSRDVAYPPDLFAVRGFVLPSKYGIPLISSYHPAFLMPRRAQHDETGSPGTMHLFGVFKCDIRFAVQCAQQGPPERIPTHYDLSPDRAAVSGYLARLHANLDLPVAYDIETAGLLGEKEPDSWKLKRIVQIQFASVPGEAMVIKWGEHDDLVREILATDNSKWSFNGRASDDPCLLAHGYNINGPMHDLYLAYQHVQPGFSSSGKDDLHGEKGIPSKLMGLQSCSSFYCPEEGPYKHMAHRIPFEPELMPLYGAYDADRTVRCGLGLFNLLRTQGLYEGYITHKVELRPVLDDLGARGLPVDRAAQAELRAYTIGELARLSGELGGLVPDELRGRHPKAGYKVLNKELKALIANGYDADNPPLVELASTAGYLVQREFEVDDDIDG